MEVFEIKSLDGKVLFSHKCNTLENALNIALNNKICLAGADFRGVNLQYVSFNLETRAERPILTGASFENANLTFADLSGVNLSKVDFKFANLYHTNLKNTVICGADFRWANMDFTYFGKIGYGHEFLYRGANFSFTDLSTTDIDGYDFFYLDLQGTTFNTVTLNTARNDFWDVLLRFKSDIPKLKATILAGKINGNTIFGDYGGLVKTMAEIKNWNIASIESNGLTYNRPISILFSTIKPGITPEKSPVYRLILEWLDEFISLISS